MHMCFNILAKKLILHVHFHSVWIYRENFEFNFSVILKPLPSFFCCNGTCAIKVLPLTCTSSPLQVSNALSFFAVMSLLAISVTFTTVQQMTRSNCALCKMSTNIVSCYILLWKWIVWKMYSLSTSYIFNQFLVCLGYD